MAAAPLKIAVNVTVPTALRDYVAGVRRILALKAANYTCEKCGFVAWSRKRLAQLVLRDRDGDHSHPRVLCPTCAEKFDARRKGYNSSAVDAY